MQWISLRKAHLPAVVGQAEMRVARPGSAFSYADTYTLHNTLTIGGALPLIRAASLEDARTAASHLASGQDPHNGDPIGIFQNRDGTWLAANLYIADGVVLPLKNSNGSESDVVPFKLSVFNAVPELKAIVGPKQYGELAPDGSVTFVQPTLQSAAILASGPAQRVTDHVTHAAKMVAKGAQSAFGAVTSHLPHRG